MIIVHLKGGIGNQLYQYAAAKSLSLTSQNELKLYFEDTNKFTNRTYALSAFNIPEPFAHPSEVRRFRPDTGMLRKLKKMMGLDVDKKLVLEKENFTFDPGFFDLRGDIFLRGYWQHLAYMKPCEAQIRKSLVFSDPPLGENKAMLERIESCGQAVSVHIRRGDYVSMSQQTGFKVLSSDYYQQAASGLCEEVPDPTFFIFSDEPDWVKNSFDFNFPKVIVDINRDQEAHKDLRLMSHCRHHIIANSTFSWWGAWLNAKSDKIVFAPRRWKENEKEEHREGRFPDSWRLI
jgi:hypothetical protein